MCVHRGVACGSREALAVAIRDVLMGLRVLKSLCQAEVNHVYRGRMIAQPDEEIVGLDIPVDEMARVDVFDARNLPR